MELELCVTHLENVLGKISIELLSFSLICYIPSNAMCGGTDFLIKSSCWALANLVHKNVQLIPVSDSRINVHVYAMPFLSQTILGY